MENKAFVLKTYEDVLIPESNNKLRSVVKTIVIAVFVLGVIASLIFRENFFDTMSSISKVMLFSVIVWIITSAPKKVSTPSEIELRFFEDYLIVYRNKRYYDSKVTRMEFDKFYFKDIEKCDYNPRTKRFNIVGVVEGIWYNYNKDGTVPTTPSYHKTTDSINYFYLFGDDYSSIISAFDQYANIKVEINN